MVDIKILIKKLEDNIKINFNNLQLESIEMKFEELNNDIKEEIIKNYKIISDDTILMCHSGFFKDNLVMIVTSKEFSENEGNCYFYNFNGITGNFSNK